MSTADLIVLALSAVSLLWSAHTWRRNKQIDKEMRAKWRRGDY